ncbi:MAG: SIR2 family protein [Gemmatimonadaceae bacterium]
MGAPANLPSFRELAREIAEPSLPLLAKDEEALDRYLGRAEHVLNVKVQERARTKLRARGGTHTPVHEHLVGLFGAPNDVRLITTNFDTHFTAAARAVFGAEHIPHYVGPALPPGRDFRGIAHLHGSLDQPQDRLVLTQKDFAAAYMTEGWAARFLVGVFAERTILFIGYRLGDPVMQYLISALPPTKRWYAFCHEQEQARWAEHDVTPVTFNTRGDGDRFGDLNEGLERWYWYAHASAVDHNRELRRLLSLGPPSSPQDADYLRVRLATQPGRVTFWNAATEPEWFAWVAVEKLLDPLFDEQSGAPEIAFWARWCLSHFCTGENPPMLHFCRRRSLRLNPTFALELALHLARTDPLPPRPVLRQLVALLVNQSARPPKGADPYDWLLRKLVDAAYAEEALAILGWMTQVSLEPLGRFHFAFEDEAEDLSQLPTLANRIALHVAPDDIDQFLATHGPALAELAAEGIVALAEQRLIEAYLLLDLAKSAGRSFDWLSYGRTSIAPSNQDAAAHAEDVLVALVRIGLDYWRDHSRDRLKTFAQRYSADDRRLLKRLALYALAGCGSVSPEDVLAMAVEKRWASDFWIRPELYRLLKAHYDAASEDAKNRFITSLRDDNSWGEFDEHKAHARFSLSQLIVRLSPSSSVTRAFAAEEKAAHPQWQEQDPDGFLTRVEVGWGTDMPSSIEPDQMVRWAPAEALERIVTELETMNASEGRQPLLGAIQQAVRAKANWGAGLLSAAAATAAAPSGVVEAIFWGLREASCTVEDELGVLECVAGWGWPDDVTYMLSSVLERWATNVKDASQINLLDALDKAADAVFVRAKTALSNLLSETGWTERAINHPAGHAASVWWIVANARDRIDGQFVVTIDKDERDRWERVLSDDTAAGAHARVILGMASDRLSTGDYPWAERVVFPAFDPSAGAEQAAQLWDGRLMHRSWSWTTVAGLRPYFSRFFANSGELVPARSREIGDWVGLLITHPIESRFSLTELQQFVHHATLDARRAFADALPRHLARLTSEARTELWQKVLAPYWSDRRTNMPVALDPSEVVEMISWIVALPEVAEAAMAELAQTPGQQLVYADRIIRDWKRNDSWVGAHPREATAIIKWLAERRSIEPWAAGYAVIELESALNAGALPSEVLAAAEALAELSCQTAIALVERLQGDQPEAEVR